MEKLIQDEIHKKISEIIKNRFISIDEQAERLIKFFSMFNGKSPGPQYMTFYCGNKSEIVEMIYYTLSTWRSEQPVTVRDTYVDTIEKIISIESAKIMIDTVIARYTPVVHTEQAPKKKPFLSFFRKK